MYHGLAAFGIGFVSLYGLWVFYLAVMSLQRALQNGTLSQPAKVLGTPVLVIGLILDALCNIVIMTILLLEFPQEWLVTKRLSRHIKKPGWRCQVAYWICSNLLDTFDPSGKHCK